SSPWPDVPDSLAECYRIACPNVTGIGGRVWPEYAIEHFKRLNIVRAFRFIKCQADLPVDVVCFKIV
ncbi:MAG: hypothetical protein P4M02_03155, partial [Clostridia bacterium]|nr:hypothetical protein [Clostridia bacterium]